MDYRNLNTESEIVKKERKISQSRRSGVGTGTTSLLMIFTVLCFATLALLSLSTAASNRRIQQRGFQGTVSLAAAEGAASEEVARIDAALAQLQQEGAGSEKKYFENAKAKAAELGWEPGAAENSVQTFVPIDENNSLVIEIILLSPSEEARYAIVKKAAFRTAEWVPEEGGVLWGGNN